jgi:hypothetical protein
MFADDESPFTPRPFWFADDELLMAVFAAEVATVSSLLANHPHIRGLFDTPDATLPERRACFKVLAHRVLMDYIDETLLGRYAQAPSLGVEEENVLSKTQNLVASDAPAWVVEMSAVVGRMPFHIQKALPESLRIQGYDSQNAELVATLKSAAATLSTVGQVRSLTMRVLDEQLQRLERRWSAETVRVPGVAFESQLAPSGTLSVKQKKKKRGSLRDRQRENRDRMIAEIADISKTQAEFLRQMDERKVPPQPTWSRWPGSWAQAYKDPHLQKLIQQDKSRALGRGYTGRKS